MTKLSFGGKLLGASVLAAVCMSITAATAFSQAPPPQKKIQIKIVVDGKDIDLGDVDLQELLAGALKKAHAQAVPDQGHSHFPPAQVIIGKAPGHDGNPKALVTPDGAILAQSDGKILILIDAKSGKVMGKFETGDQAPHDVLMKLKLHDPDARPVQVQATWKSDPRIEELVRQAEAIKPGSGAQVRAALGAMPEYGRVTLPLAPIAPMGPHAIAKSVAGDKVIVIMVHDGKVLQLQGSAPGGTPHVKPDDVKAVNLQKAIDLMIKSGQMKEMKKGHEPPVAKPASGHAAPDLEAIARQIERLNAELNELRRRLDAEKKTPQ